MGATHALDCIEDPLITPLLALLRDAVNFDLNETMELMALTDGVEPTPAINRIEPRPLDLLIEGDGTCPVLGCFRTRVRTKQVTFGFKDNYTTLQFRYITSGCGVEKLGARWPLLHCVWESIIATLTAGHHPAHRDDFNVLGNIGITWVNFETADKQELYAENGHFSFPAFIGTIEIRTRLVEERPEPTYPALSFLTKIYAEPAVDGQEREPDVQALDFTPIGQEERDSQYADDEQELGSDIL